MNLYQSMKAPMNAVFATKPGGTMILTLDCPDIKEPTVFTDWFFRSDMTAFERDLRADFSIPAFVAFKSHCIFRSMQAVYVVTRPENFDIIRQSGLIPAASLEAAGKKRRPTFPKITPLPLWAMQRRPFPYYKAFFSRSYKLGYKRSCQNTASFFYIELNELKVL